jgi:quercetin dioxygenase-like cupin family protein
MIEEFYKEIEKKLPNVKLSIPGAKGWCLQGPDFQIVFFEMEESVFVPPHSHRNQFGFVLDGHGAIKIGEKKHVLTSGSTYFIPEGVVHEAAFDTFTRVVDVFFEKDRYEVEE